MSQKLTREDHKAKASRWLNLARSQGEAPGCIAYMREHLTLGNWTLADIGTSEEDLSQLLKNSIKDKALLLK